MNDTHSSSTHLSTSTEAGASQVSPGQVSRRRLLGGVGAALGLGTVLVAMDSASAQVRLEKFNVSGEALEPAVRVPPTTTAITTTTTPAPPDGQIMFPIIVGPDDFCWVSNSFGDCRGSGCSRSHEGVDIMADRGLPVRAPVAGQLTKQYVDSGASSGAGHGWTLLDESGDITYKFFHLERHEDGLAVGDEVEAGQIIGYVGNTGTSGVSSGTNYHLHFEYRPDNVAADSFELLVRDEHVDFAGE